MHRNPFSCNSGISPGGSVDCVPSETLDWVESKESASRKANLKVVRHHDVKYVIT